MFKAISKTLSGRIIPEKYILKYILKNDKTPETQWNQGFILAETERFELSAVSSPVDSNTLKTH